MDILPALLIITYMAIGQPGVAVHTVTIPQQTMAMCKQSMKTVLEAEANAVKAQAKNNGPLVAVLQVQTTCIFR